MLKKCFIIKTAKEPRKIFSSEIVSLRLGSSSQKANLKFSDSREDLFPALKNNLTQISSSKSPRRVLQSVARREPSERKKSETL